MIVHTAAQPSHDRAAAIPFLDFDVNAVGALNLLEAVRRHCPEPPCIHMSTNKVYGDRPSNLKLKELDTRGDYDDPDFGHCIPQPFSIDQLSVQIAAADRRNRSAKAREEAVS